MNIVNLVGRLAKDPVARDRSDTRITELILVTERPVIRDGKVQKDPETGYPVKDAEFHKITVFNGLGLPLRQHKAKGDQLAVTTARVGLSSAELMAMPQSGSLFGMTVAAGLYLAEPLFNDD